MIDTVVFDLGGVLVRFDPRKGLEDMGFSEEVISLFMKEIFSGLWEAMDAVDIDEAEIRKIFKEKVPGYEKEVDYLWDNLPLVTGNFPYSRKWLESLKKKGMKLYILSNYGKASFAINSKTYNFLDLFDGGVISYELEKVKPDPAIYNTLFERYNIKPENAVFIDDRSINIEGARNAGMQGIVFTTYEETSKALTEMLSHPASSCQ